MYLVQKLVLVFYDTDWQKFVMYNLKHVGVVKVGIVFIGQLLLNRDMEKRGLYEV